MSPAFRFWASLVAQMVKNLHAMQETRVWSLDWEDSPGEGNSYSLLNFDLQNYKDRGAWQATIHAVTKSWTRLSYFHSLTWTEVWYNNWRNNYQKYLLNKKRAFPRLNLESRKFPPVSHFRGEEMVKRLTLNQVIINIHNTKKKQ